MITVWAWAQLYKSSELLLFKCNNNVTPGFTAEPTLCAPKTRIACNLGIENDTIITDVLDDLMNFGTKYARDVTFSGYFSKLLRVL